VNRLKPIYVPLLISIAALLRAVWAQHPYALAGQPCLIHYESPVDGSQQAYGVYVPQGPPPETGYPAAFHTHGYGWAVSSSFSDWQKAWADGHRWVLINLNARGPQFYEGIGEVATMEVVRDATARFGLDPERLYITGSSMGGTGAFRHGVRHPYTFAAAVGVDGWTDYRLWHHHWYARADARDAIEEFRRPLLQAASPLYWAQRSQWGAVRAVVDGRDTTVLPDNGLQLYAALSELAYQRGGYDSALSLNYDKGHGGGYSLADIYQFFLGRARVSQPHSFHCRTYLLKHGQMYWGRIDSFRTFGLPASLVSSVAGSTVNVVTGNVDHFSLHLQASPAAESEQISVYADGLHCYSGPPATLFFEALYNCDGQVAAWVPGADLPALGPYKTPELAGPIGEVFTGPFVVAYATAGSDAMTQQHRREAHDFVAGWRGFMIRRGAEPDAIGPYPEQAVSSQMLQDSSLVIFGSRESSRLLRMAYSAADIPVVVGDHYVTVADQADRQRTYYGDNFGCFVCYPNPLSDVPRYLLIARGQWFTKPDATIPAGLEYDMEKLPWAYPDYVIFNTDQAQLPHVLNVNNKPPVTCYEAGYFVEAGFFDDRWRPDRAITLDRAWLAEPAEVKFIHVERIKASEVGAEVLVVDAAGLPTAGARVTLTWPDAARSVSALTGEDGWARIPGPADTAAQVVSVMATGAVYDFTADVAHATADGPLSLTLSRPRRKADAFGNCYYELTASLTNHGQQRATGHLYPSAVAGRWTPQVVRLALEPSQKTDIALRWHPGQYNDDVQTPSGEYLLTVTARPDSSTPAGFWQQPVVATANLSLGLVNFGPLVVDQLQAHDLRAGQPYQVSCDVLNAAAAEAAVELACSIVPAGLDLGAAERCHYLSPRTVTVPGMDKVTVEFKQDIADARLPVGLYEAVIYAPGHPELTSRVTFSVTPPP